MARSASWRISDHQQAGWTGRSSANRSRGEYLATIDDRTRRCSADQSRGVSRDSDRAPARLSRWATFRGGSAAGLPTRSLVVPVCVARRRAAVPRRRSGELSAFEPSDEPVGSGAASAAYPEMVSEIPVVRDHEDLRGRVRSVHRSNIVNQRHDQCVGAASARVAHPDARRNAFAAQSPFGRTVEHELDRDRGRDDRPQPADQCGRRLPVRAARQGIQQVRAVDDEPARVRERVARPIGHW